MTHRCQIFSFPSVIQSGFIQVLKTALKNMENYSVKAKISVEDDVEYYNLMFLTNIF